MRWWEKARIDLAGTRETVEVAAEADRGGGLQGERGRLLDWGNGIEYYNIVKITR